MNGKPKLYTCLSPSLIPLYPILDNAIVVVIDIFRATSTICAALDNGARAIIPVDSVEECRNISHVKPDIITAGELDGIVQKGLDKGNSPLEFTPEVIHGKTLALTTTNGTKLLHLVKDAKRVITGSFLNLDAVCDYLLDHSENVILACAGWKHKINLEDSLFAGMVIHKIKEHYTLVYDGCLIANALFEDSQQYPTILEYLKLGNHYDRLKGFNRLDDLEYCCQFNLHPVVPVFKDPFLVTNELCPD